MVALGQGLAAVGSLASVYFVTRVLDPAAYGELALCLAFAAVAQGALSSLTQSFVRYFVPAQETGQLPAFLRAAGTLSWKASAIHTGLMLLLIAGLALCGYRSWLPLAVTGGVFALLSTYSTSLDGIQNAVRQRGVVALHQVLTQWLRPLTAVALMWIWRPASEVAMLGWILGSAIVFVSQAAFLNRTLRPMQSQSLPVEAMQIDLWKTRILLYATPFLAWSVIAGLQMSSSRWALQTFQTPSEVGRYAVLYQLGYSPIVLLSTLLNQLTMPILFGRAGDGTDASRIRATLKANDWLILLSLGLTTIGMLLAYALHGAVFAVMAPASYRQISALLPWMVLASGLFATGQIATTSLLIATDAKRLLVPKIATSVIGIALTFAAARYWGLAGSISADVAFSAVYCAWMCVLSRRMSTSNPSAVPHPPLAKAA